MNGIGLFGGTFNPIHLGHLRAAQEVKGGFHLERICFIPCAIPPHKGDLDLARARDRYHMLAEAIDDNPGFVASDVELERQGRSYTIDTVRHYQSMLDPDTPCYLIVGMDAFLEISTWKSYKELFDLIPFIVMKRPVRGVDIHLDINLLRQFIQENISPSYVLSEDGSRFYADCKMPIYLFHVTPMDISSTRIRALIRNGASIKYLVPDAVEKYIQAKGLYR